MDNIQFPLPVLYQNGKRSLVPLEGVEPLAIVFGKFAVLDEAPQKMLLSSARRYCQKQKFRTYRISLGKKVFWKSLICFSDQLDDFNKTAELVGFKPIVFDAPYWYEQKDKLYGFGVSGKWQVRSCALDDNPLFKVRPVISLP